MHREEKIQIVIRSPRALKKIGELWARQLPKDLLFDEYARPKHKNDYAYTACIAETKAEWNGAFSDGMASELLGDTAQTLSQDIQNAKLGFIQNTGLAQHIHGTERGDIDYVYTRTIHQPDKPFHGDIAIHQDALPEMIHAPGFAVEIRIMEEHDKILSLVTADDDETDNAYLKAMISTHRSLQDDDFVTEGLREVFRDNNQAVLVTITIMDSTISDHIRQNHKNLEATLVDNQSVLGWQSSLEF